jgi:hypothetical protein
MTSGGDTRERGHGADGTPRMTRVRRHAGRARRDARALAAELGTVSDELRAVLGEQAARRPYAALAAAWGVGYLLGGGVPARATRTALDYGIRAALAVALQRLLAGEPSAAAGGGES